MRSWETIQSQVRAKIRQIREKALTPKSPVPSEVDQIVTTFLRRHHYKVNEWWNPETKGRIVTYLNNWVASIEYTDKLKILLVAEKDKSKEVRIDLHDPESFKKLLTTLREMWKMLPESRRWFKNGFWFFLDTIYQTSFLKIPTVLWIMVFLFFMAEIVPWFLRNYVW